MVGRQVNPALGSDRLQKPSPLSGVTPATRTQGTAGGPEDLAEASRANGQPGVGWVGRSLCGGRVSSPKAKRPPDLPLAAPGPVFVSLLQTLAGRGPFLMTNVTNPERPPCCEGSGRGRTVCGCLPPQEQGLAINQRLPLTTCPRGSRSCVPRAVPEAGSERSGPSRASFAWGRGGRASRHAVFPAVRPPRGATCLLWGARPAHKALSVSPFPPRPGPGCPCRPRVLPGPALQPKKGRTWPPAGLQGVATGGLATRSERGLGGAWGVPLRRGWPPRTGRNAAERGHHRSSVGAAGHSEKSLGGRGGGEVAGARAEAPPPGAALEGQDGGANYRPGRDRSAEFRALTGGTGASSCLAAVPGVPSLPSQFWRRQATAGVTD